MLESTVSDETLDGVFENVGEGHWLRIDAYISLSWSSR